MSSRVGNGNERLLARLAICGSKFLPQFTFSFFIPSFWGSCSTDEPGGKATIFQKK
jgi:hypothetical protein